MLHSATECAWLSIPIEFERTGPLCGNAAGALASALPTTPQSSIISLTEYQVLKIWLAVMNHFQYSFTTCRAPLIQNVMQFLIAFFDVALMKWHRLRTRAKLGDVRIHDARHSFASRALAIGESLPTIGRLLGHRRVTTTARYAHLARDTERASAVKVGGSIGADILGNGKHAGETV